MKFDLSGIKLRAPQGAPPKNPVEIFERLTLRGTIKNIWQPQNEAITNWYKGRDQDDIGIEMMTGGGKTLVGLLVGQSSINELRRPGLYVCPTIQLAEQTRVRAEENGFETATYFDGQWQDREVYSEARGLCITNYAAVFNSHARLRKGPLPGVVVFDDAHVADDEIRKQFSIRINRGHAAYQPILDLLRPQFTGAHEAAKLTAIGRGDPLPLLFLPLYETRRVSGALEGLLRRHGVDQPAVNPERGASDPWFAWGWIGSRLETCTVILHARRIEIAPPVPPLHSVWCMGKSVRRIYLTATLPSSTSFAQTFGIPDLSVVRPGGKSGAAQRLFIFPPGESDDEQRAWVREHLAQEKAVIIVPSRRAAKPWLSEATLFDREDRNEDIQRFADAPAPEKLILVARYHGIDLPGDACRVLVLDGLPRGGTLLNQFLAEGLQAETLRAATTAVRVVQAIGRIFRSNTDHGAVVVCGVDLQQWLRNPGNRAFFPPLLQQQIGLGLALRDQVVAAGQVSYQELLEGVLTGDRTWDAMYKENIATFDPESLPSAPTWLSNFAAREHEAFAELWEGNAAEASSQYGALAEEAEGQDADLAAWYHHWAGVAYDELGRSELAVTEYLAAADRRATLGRPALNDTGIRSKSAPRVSPQAEAIVEHWNRNRSKVLGRARTVAELFVGALPPTSQVEAALAELGTLLGLVATRPDTPSEGKTGPDVAWRPIGGGEGLGLEAKTGKEPQSQYNKDSDVGQIHDHVEWAAEKYPGERFSFAWVGALLPVSNESHPPKGLRVIEPTAFADLGQRVTKIYEVLSGELGEPAGVTVERYLRALGLKWPECWRSLPSTLAVDLQQREEDGE